MLATIIIQCAVQADNSAAGGSAVISLGTADPALPSFAYQLPNIIGRVSISSATFNAAAQSAFTASGGTLT